jgi:hypothetical protein
MRKLVYTNPLGVSITFDDTLYGITKLEGIDIAPLAIQEQLAPFQDGTTPIDQLFTFREIDAEGVIACGGNPLAIYTARRALLAALNPKLGPGTLVYTSDFGSWQLNDVTPEGQAPLFPNRNANDGSQQWLITFHCADPYFYDLKAQSIPLQDTVGATLFPIVFPASGIVLSYYSGAGGSAETSDSINNAGDWETPVSIKLYGPCVNPKILNVTTGDYIRVEISMEAGDLLEITTAFGNKSVIYTPSGGVPVSAITLLDLSSTFFQLAVGNNELLLSDDSFSATDSCTVTWTNRYIGV